MCSVSRFAGIMLLAAFASITVDEARAQETEAKTTTVKCQPRLILNDSKKSSFITSVAFSQDGTLLASSGWLGDESVRVWDVTTGVRRAELKHKGGDGGQALFTPDGKALICLFHEVHRLGRGKKAPEEYSQVIEAWDLNDLGKGKTRVFESEIGKIGIWAIRLPPDGSSLALIAANQISFLEAPTWRVRPEVALPNRWDDGYATDATFSPDGGTLATLGRLGVQLWDLKTGQMRTRLPLNGDTCGSNGIAFSPNGKYLAASCAAGLVIWYLNASEPIKVIKQPRPQRIHSDPLVYSPDGTLLVAGYTDGTFHIWRTSNFHERLIVNGDTKGITALAFSPDGKTLVSGGYERTIKLWDIPRLVSRFEDEGQASPKRSTSEAKPAPGSPK